jgi:hypothetical protein
MKHEIITAFEPIQPTQQEKSQMLGNIFDKMDKTTFRPNLSSGLVPTMAALLLIIGGAGVFSLWLNYNSGEIPVVSILTAESREVTVITPPVVTDENGVVVVPTDYETPTGEPNENGNPIATSPNSTAGTAQNGTGNSTKKSSNSNQSTPPQQTMSDSFAKWVDDFFEGDRIISAMEETPAKKNTVILLGSSHGWRGVDTKPISNAEVSAQFNKLRSNFKTIDPFYIPPQNIYPYGMICFDDGTKLVMLERNRGIMGGSIKTLNQYVSFDDEFFAYFGRIYHAYPNRYYGGTFENGKLEYELWYDAQSVPDLVLTSLTRDYRNDNGIDLVTAKFDVVFPKREPGLPPAAIRQEINMSGELAFSDDNFGGDGFQTFTVHGNTTIEFTMEVGSLPTYESWNDGTRGTYNFRAGNIVYSITLLSRLPSTN